MQLFTEITPARNTKANSFTNVQDGYDEKALWSSHRCITKIITREFGDHFLLKKSKRGIPFLEKKNPSFTKINTNTPIKNKTTESLRQKDIPFISIAHTSLQTVRTNELLKPAPPTRTQEQQASMPIFLAFASAQTAIGVDCQWVNSATTKLPTFLTLAKRYFSQQENNILQKISSKTRKQEIFFQMFTLKEAFIKAQQTTLLAGMKTCTINLPQHWQWQYFTTQHGQQGYVAVTVLCHNIAKEIAATRKPPNSGEEKLRDSVKNNSQKESMLVLKWKHVSDILPS